MKRTILIITVILISLISYSQSKSLTVTGLAKDSTIEYSIIDLDLYNYDSLLNDTREKAGVNKLYRDERYDSIARERCFELSKELLGSDDPRSLTRRFVHVLHRYQTGENAFTITYEFKLRDTSSLEFINKKYISDEMLKKVDYAKIINNAYNNSQAHYKNRTRDMYGSYGSAAISLAYFTSNNTVFIITISYDCFRLAK